MICDPWKREKGMALGTTPADLMPSFCPLLSDTLGRVSDEKILLRIGAVQNMQQGTYG